MIKKLSTNYNEQNLCESIYSLDSNKKKMVKMNMKDQIYII